MKKENKYKGHLELIVMFLLFFGLVFFAIKSGIADDLKPAKGSSKWIIFIGMIAVMHIVLAIHELGHLLTGLFQGFRFDLFVVGFLGIKREDDQVKVYFNKNLGLYGGVAGTSPKDDSIDNPKKFANILLAGPIASILFAIICFIIMNYLGKPFGLFAFTAGIMSIGIFFATTIPSKTGMFFTDRKRYQRLVTPGKDQDVEIAMISIMGKYAQDNSYKNIEKEEIELLIGDDEKMINFYGLFNMMCWQLEHNGEIDDALNEQYEDASRSVSKSMATSFRKEVEKYAERRQ